LAIIPLLAKSENIISEKKTARAPGCELDRDFRNTFHFPLRPELIMNLEAELPKIVEDFAHRATHEVSERFRREPGKVLAVAAGAFLAYRLVPKRWIAGGALSLTQAALVAMGLCKALDLCRTGNFNPATSTPAKS
jgi:hypothetical protein